MRSAFLAGLLIIALLAGACKKTKTQPEAYVGLNGTWIEQTPPASQSRNLTFSGDSVHFSVTDRTDPANPLVTNIDGTYSTNGHQLSTVFKKIVMRQYKQVIYYGQYNGNIFDNATYDLNNNQLVIHYTSYPADGPSPTTMTLNRQLPD